MKRFFILLLTLALTLSMAACGGDDAKTTTAATTAAETTVQETTVPETTVSETTVPETTVPETTVPETTAVETTAAEIDPNSPFDQEAAAPVIGTWKFQLTMTAEHFGLDDDDFTLVCPAAFTFDDRGQFAFGYLTDEMGDIIASFKSYMISYMTDLMYKQFSDQGLSKEEADAAFLSQNNMTIAAYCEKTVNGMNIENMFSAASSTGVYYVKDGKLYTGATYSKYMEVNNITAEGDTLTLLDTNDPDSWAAMGVELPLTLTRVK